MICHDVYFYTKLSKSKAVYKQHLNHKVLVFGGTEARENTPCQKYKRLYLEYGESLPHWVPLENSKNTWQPSARENIYACTKPAFICFLTHQNLPQMTRRPYQTLQESVNSAFTLRLNSEWHLQGSPNRA